MSPAQVWKKDLQQQNPKAAESLADPDEYPNLFPDLQLALKAEELSARRRQGLKLAAEQYGEYEGATLINLIAQVGACSQGWAGTRAR